MILVMIRAMVIQGGEHKFLSFPELITMSLVFHSSVNEIVPWQATYEFPSQATAVTKQVVKLQTKEGGPYSGSAGGKNIFRIDFPSDGYLNMQNTMLTFDFLPTATSISGSVAVVPEYGLATDATVANQVNATAQGATVANYYAGWYVRVYTATGEPDQNEALLITASTAAANTVLTLSNGATMPKGEKCDLLPGMFVQQGGGHQLIQRVRILYGGLVLEDINNYNVLSRIIQTMAMSPEYCGSAGQILEGCYYGQPCDTTVYKAGTNDAPAVGQVMSPVAGALNEMAAVLYGIHNNTAGITGRRYALRLMTGLMQSKKLIPLKWMAAQFQLEITLANPLGCMVSNMKSTPGYTVNNVNLIAELHEYDSAYDAAFVLGGLGGAGVPIKFTSWHYYNGNVVGNANNMVNISERARSIKCALAVLRDSAPSYQYDSCAFYHNPGAYYTEQSGQTGTGGLVTRGSSAAWIPVSSYQFRIGGHYYPAQQVDCSNLAVEPYMELLKVVGGLGVYTFSNPISQGNWTSAINEFDGQSFIMSARFENQDISPDTISGINGENQQSIQFILNINGTIPSQTSKLCEIFVAYDALIIVRQNNVIDLVQ